MLILEGLVGLLRTIQFQLLQQYCWGMGLDYCDSVAKIPWRRERLPLQHCGLEHFRGCRVHGVAKSWIRVSEFDFHCDTEWFALEMNKDHSVVYEIASKYCISDSFVDYDSYSLKIVEVMEFQRSYFQS